MADFINDNYISLKVNGQEGIGAEYKNKFNVVGYPTVLLLTAGGEEVERLFGWQNEPETYFQLLVDYTNGVNTVEDLLDDYAAQPDNIEQNYRVARRRMDRGERWLTRPYYEKILVLDPEDQFGYGIEAKGTLAVLDLYEKDDDHPIRSLLRGNRDAVQLTKGYDVLIRYYKHKEEGQKVLGAYDSVLTYLPDDTGFLNGYAWYVYEQKIEARYAHAITCAENAVRIKPEKANIWDTLAWLEYETGQTEKAIVHMEKACALDPEREYYAENLASMKNSRKDQRNQD